MERTIWVAHYAFGQIWAQIALIQSPRKPTSSPKTSGEDVGDTLVSQEGARGHAKDRSIDLQTTPGQRSAATTGRERARTKLQRRRRPGPSNGILLFVDRGSRERRNGPSAIAGRQPRRDEADARRPVRALPFARAASACGARFFRPLGPASHFDVTSTSASRDTSFGTFKSRCRRRQVGGCARRLGHDPLRASRGRAAAPAAVTVAGSGREQSRIRGRRILVREEPSPMALRRRPRPPTLVNLISCRSASRSVQRQRAWPNTPTKTPFRPLLPR
jgi:hypothetical protein